MRGRHDLALKPLLSLSIILPIARSKYFGKPRGGIFTSQTASCLNIVDLVPAVLAKNWQLPAPSRARLFSYTSIPHRQSPIINYPNPQHPTLRAP